MLENRSDELEIMDDLSISGEVIDQTLKELNTINKVLGGNAISLSSLKSKIKRGDKLADLGCGGGDIMMEMAKWCRKQNLEITFEGIDANKHIVQYARKNTEAYKEINYTSIDIFSEEFATRKYDIIHCCLFLHHFSSEQLINLFKQFKSQATSAVIVNDLHRHPLAYWSIKWLTRFFSKSEMVRNDAAVSVARGFKKSELQNMLEQAGIHTYSLKWKWAFRWELVF